MFLKSIKIGKNLQILSTLRLFAIRNIVVIFQTTILRFVGFYVRHSAMILQKWFHSFVFAPLSCWGFIVTLVCTQRFDRKSTFADVLTSIFLKKEPPLNDEKWAALLIYSCFFMTFKYLWILFLVLFETQFHFISFFTILIFVL